MNNKFGHSLAGGKRSSAKIAVMVGAVIAVTGVMMDDIAGSIDGSIEGSIDASSMGVCRTPTPRLIRIHWRLHTHWRPRIDIRTTIHTRMIHTRTTATTGNRKQ